MATTTVTTTVLAGDEKMLSHSEERKLIRNEIVETEIRYCEALELLEGIYIKKLQKEKAKADKYDLQPKTFDALIMNLPTLIPINMAFLKELKATDPLEVATVLDKYSDMFKIYTDYTNEFDVCMSTLSELKRNNKKLRPILEEIDKQLQLVGPKVNLMAYLIMPVQRIPRYQLLLRSLIKASSSGHPRYAEMEKAQDKLKKIATYMNENKARRENMRHMMEICEKLKGVPSSIRLIAPHRKLVKDGPITVWMSSGLKDKSSMKINQRHAYLFNDYLIICKTDGATFRGSLRLSAATVEKKDEKDFSVVTAQTAFGFRVEEKEAFEQWTTIIEQCIEKGKKMRHSKRNIKSHNKRSLNKGRDKSVHDLISNSMKDINLKKKQDPPE